MNSTHHPRSYRHYDPHSSPSIVRRMPGEGILSAIERHRRRTGWQGSVVVVPG